MKSLFFTLITILWSTSSWVNHKDSQRLQLDISNYQKVHFYNTGGAIKVNSTNSGNQAIINATRNLSATNSTKLNRAKTEIVLDTMIVDGELYVYISSPYKVLTGGMSEYLHYQQAENYKATYNSIKESGIKYEFELDISLPKHTNAVVSTHKGDIDLHGVTGDLAVLNHHGNIELQNVQNVKDVKTHHGNIEISFDKQSNYDIDLATHHGDITVKFPNTPSVELELDSYHGSFYTDFEYEPGPVLIEKREKSNSTKYKMGSKTRVLMGNAEKKISFDSHHGNMYILKK